MRVVVLLCEGSLVVVFVVPLEAKEGCWWTHSLVVLVRKLPRWTKSV